MLSIFIATHSEKTVLAEGKGRELRQEGHRTEMKGTKEKEDLMLLFVFFKKG